MAKQYTCEMLNGENNATQVQFVIEADSAEYAQGWFDATVEEYCCTRYRFYCEEIGKDGEEVKSFDKVIGEEASALN